MRSLKSILPILFFLMSPWAFGQYISINENYTTTQLVNDVLINNPCATGSNVSVSGWTFTSGGSFGVFERNGSVFPFESGVILSTGRAASAVGPNQSLLSEGPTNWPGDNDLEAALQVSGTINATVLEFDFLPVADKFSFDYIFASEQYLTNPSSNQCNYTDGLAFLLKKANTTEAYSNLALVPGTNTPVRVNSVRGPGTVCPPANPQWFDAFNDLEHPTNFNGQTRIMTASADVEPGVLYHIKIVIADQGNNLYDSALFLGAGSFKVTKNLGPDRLIASGNPLCSGQDLQLDASMSGAVSYKWFKDNTPILGATSSTYLVTQNGNYTVEIDLGSGCFANGEIQLEYAPAGTAIGTTLTQCDPDQDGQTLFNLNLVAELLQNQQVNILGFYPTQTQAQNQIGLIAQPSQFLSSHANRVYARVRDNYNCESIAEILLQISNNTLNDVSKWVCDTDGTPDGIMAFDLSAIQNEVATQIPSGLVIRFYESMSDALSGQNPLSTPYINTTPYQQYLYATAFQPGSCFGIATIDLRVSSVDSSDALPESLILCQGASETLVAPSGYSYQWSTQESTQSITINSAGTYTVTMTNSEGCSAQKTYVVQSLEAPVFLGADIRDFSGNANSIQINFSGNSDYSFSIDGLHYQTTPTFTGLNPGTYPIYIRQADCQILIGPYWVSLLDYPRYFSPNGDGANDIWTIPNLSSSSLIHIFDRYGKILKSLKANEYWDGMLNGQPLPSTDYWFVLQRPNLPDFKAHFSLIR